MLAALGGYAYVFAGWGFGMDFGLGLVVAELCHRHDAIAASHDAAYATARELLSQPKLLLTATGLRGVLADACALGMLAFIALAPDDAMRGGYPSQDGVARGVPLLTMTPSGVTASSTYPVFTLVHAAFVYGSAAGGSAGVTAHLLRHPVLASLGSYAFAAYLLQFGLMEAMWLRWPLGEPVPPGGNPEFALAVYVALLWIIAVAYTDLLEGPAVLFARARIERCAAACAGLARRPGASSKEKDGPAKQV